MKSVYTLQCQNVPICDIVIELNHIIDIVKVHSKNYAPIEIIPFNELSLERLNRWLSERAIPIERDGYRQLIDDLKMKNSQEYLINNFALSLCDQYWLKPYQSNITWEDVNLFDKDYSVIEFSDATFGKDNSISSSWNTIHMDTQNLRTPQASLGGVLKKIWIQKDKVNYMIKGSHTLYNLEPVHEVLASKIAQRLHVDAVEYELVEIKGKRTYQLASICKDIVDSSQHIVSAYALILGFPEAQIKDYATYIDFLETELSIAHAKEDIQKMMMLDYLMMNEDRHLNNFGVIRNSYTLKWEKVCPIYDTGKSLNTSINEDYWDFENGEVRSFEGDIVSVHTLIEFIHIPIEKECITSIRELYSWYRGTLFKHQDVLKLKNNTIQRLSQGFLKRVDCFEKAMREKNLIIDNER